MEIALLEKALLLPRVIWGEHLEEFSFLLKVEGQDQTSLFV